MFKNILSNYIGRIWSLISVFVFIPLYIKLLGVEAYGVISFYTVILTIMYFADAGLSATLNREIARTDDKLYIGNLLFTIERLYLAICLFVSLSIFFASPTIANNWLNTTVISDVDLRNFIIIIGFSISFQLFNTLENSGLMGLEKQVLANSIQVSGSIIRSAVVLIPLYFYPSLYVYFFWQLASNVSVFLITRHTLWRFIKTDAKYVFDRQILKQVGGFAGGMILMAIIASLNTQIDKLLVSKLLTLKEFSYYSLAGIISQSPEILITPIAVAILPRLTKFATAQNKNNLIKLFHQYSVIMASITCAVTVVLILFTRDFVVIWTSSTDIANSIQGITKVLLIGSVFLAFQYMPYYLAISHGHTDSNVKLGLACLVFIIPALSYSIKHFGLEGAPWAWLIMNVFACFYLGYFIINRFLRGEFRSWLIDGVIIPITVSFFIGVVGYYLTLGLPKGYYVLGYSVVVGLLSITLTLKIYNVRNVLSQISIIELIRSKDY
jgi:O-antigen/teichoic acid export membrane protein